jgi:hypothetical protein
MEAIGLITPDVANNHKDFAGGASGLIGLLVQLERPKVILHDWSLFPVAPQ